MATDQRVPKETQAWVLGEEGRLFHETGDDTQARACCERVLSVVGEGDQLRQAQRSLWLGHALTGLGHLAEAHEVYRASAAQLGELGHYHSSIAAVSGLAGVALASGRPAEALAHVEEVLSYLDAHPALDASGELFSLYLTCYRVLRANEDPRAGELLSRAYGVLREWADRIEDPTLRRSFLENVAVNREIVREFTRNDPSS